MASGIIPAYENIAEDLGVTLQQTTYLTSIRIAVIGGAPLFWRPLSTRYGRRPIFIISLIGSNASTSAAQRPRHTRQWWPAAPSSPFSSPPPRLSAPPSSSKPSSSTILPGTKHERAKFMGVWTIMLTIGVPLAPFIFGFVIYNLFLYIFLGPETRFIRPYKTEQELPSFKDSYFKFRRIDPTSITAYEFVSPLRLAAYPCVVIPAASYAMVFLFASVLSTVEVPQLFGEKFHLNAQQIGLQFLSLVIGSIIGEQVGGRASDTWMRRGGRKRADGRPAPEFRLWLTYLGYALVVCGIVVFLVRIEQAVPLEWNVTPVVGVAIAAAGNQIVTTVLITYAVDCYHEEAGSIGVFISFVRQIWGFIGPFWFPRMFEDVGIANSAGVAVAMLVVVSVVPTLILQWRGKIFRQGEMEARI
ncbi:MFS general substrate transporter [Karstenula rhodostoma CBS 690.94]|uniref:MFS general substrate transporter n=1 Tax=Karstenula rhodostoma CBS 690.94 TaxID=1392251 RepID=A0A9P4PRU9_9PLEO|nr:MFS general substrate transporter [Karstenula rhodostoma CBS 690.94]